MSSVGTKHVYQVRQRYIELLYHHAHYAYTQTINDEDEEDGDEYSVYAAERVSEVLILLSSVTVNCFLTR
jgi:hypothetical protein